MLVLSLLACTRSPSVEVLAAASLTDALSEVARAWEGDGHPPVVPSFDASSRLAAQIDAGAPVDLFFSADTAWMDWLTERGRVVAETRVDLLSNQLVVVVPVAHTAPFGLEELAKVEHLALAGEEVPAGRYARAALAGLGLWDAVQAEVVSADHVRAAMGWVALGHADAGIVYATDARVEPRVRVAFVLDPASHPPIVLPAARVTGASHGDAADDFLAFCRGPVGAGLFRDAGFGVP